MINDRRRREPELRAAREQQVLLVLDDCEHLLDAAPRLAELLGACGQLKVLAASREPI